MATTTKTTATKKNTELLYDSKAGGSAGSPAYTEITIVIESKPTSQYVGRTYKKSPTGAKYWGERFDDYLSDYGYDEAGARYRITAKAVDADKFEEAFKA